MIGVESAIAQEKENHVVGEQRENHIPRFEKHAVSDHPRYGIVTGAFSKSGLWQ